jgi:hypothetical protein
MEYKSSVDDLEFWDYLSFPGGSPIRGYAMHEQPREGGRSGPMRSSDPLLALEALRRIVADYKDCDDRCGCLTAGGLCAFDVRSVFQSSKLAARSINLPSERARARLAGHLGNHYEDWIYRTWLDGRRDCDEPDRVRA